MDTHLNVANIPLLTHMIEDSLKGLKMMADGQSAHYFSINVVAHSFIRTHERKRVICKKKIAHVQQI